MNAVTPYGQPPARVTEPQQGREPPHNYEAEQVLLAGLLARNGAHDDVAEFLRPEHFAEPLHGRIFEAITRLVSRGQAANPVTLKNLFDQDGALVEIGGAKYLVDLANAVVTTIGLADYGREIVALAKRRALIGAAELAVREAYIFDDSVTIDAQIGSFEAQLTEIQGMGLVGEEATPLGPIVMSAITKAQDAYQNGGQDSGVLTGIRALDRKLGGLQPGDLILIGARPSMGKTALGLNIATNVAADGLPDAFFSMEMTKMQLGQRHIAAETGITVDKQRRGEVDQIGFQSMMEAQQRIERMPLFIDDAPALSLAQLRARTRRAVRRHGVKLVVIDYLGLMKPTTIRRNGSRNDDVSEISQGLKALAKELAIPVIALCQLSRANESREDKRPGLPDLRDSGSLEQDADVVIFVHREEYYLSRQEPKPRAGEDDTKFSSRVADWHSAMAKVQGKAELIIAKQRQGPIGIVECEFDGPRTKFRDSDIGDQK